MVVAGDCDLIGKPRVTVSPTEPFVEIYYHSGAALNLRIRCIQMHYHLYHLMYPLHRLTYWWVHVDPTTNNNIIKFKLNNTASDKQTHHIAIANLDLLVTRVWWYLVFNCTVLLLISFYSVRCSVLLFISSSISPSSFGQ